jgi:hypothetical protein
MTKRMFSAYEKAVIEKHRRKEVITMTEEEKQEVNFYCLIIDAAVDMVALAMEQKHPEKHKQFVDFQSEVGCVAV